MPDLQLGVPDRPDRDAAQVLDRVADRIAHVAHLPVAPLVDGQDERRLLVVTPRRQQPDFGRRGPSSADHDSARQPIEIVRVRHAEDASFVDAGDLVARVGEARREIAVIGQEQQAFRLVVEPPGS